MKTAPEQAFKSWVEAEDSLRGHDHDAAILAESAFLAGAKWAIGELDERMKDAEPLVGDSIPPIAGDA